MIAGPIFSREVLTTPRQLRHYLMRSGYVGLLFILMYTAGQTTFGWQLLRNVGDVSLFGSLIFQLLSVVQLSLVSFFALLFVAGNVAQEKDRQTLILLLMTDLRNHELVLGKMLASLLVVAVLLASSLPVFCFVHLMGGVSAEQIAWSMGICLVTAFVCGSWGALVAFWREKTFQILASTVLGAVLFLGLIEAVVVLGGNSALGNMAGLLNPFRAMLSVLSPLAQQNGVGTAEISVWQSVLALSVIGLVLNCITILRLRIWNPTRFVYQSAKSSSSDDQAITTAPADSRKVWESPIIWREICTRAYGRKVAIIKIAYLVLAAFVSWLCLQPDSGTSLILGMISSHGFGFVVLGLLSLILINAQAVTSITSERDGKTLELLLITDVTAKEFVYGKLGGVLYNTKELIIIPLGLIVYATCMGILSVENFILILLEFLVLVGFVATLGLHSGLSFDNSRNGIANSLGTVFFLFVGIFVFMLLLVEARGSFMIQFQSFLVFIVAGSIGLYASLTSKNPSLALTISAAVLPMLTFYALTSFLLSEPIATLIAVTFAYGWTTLAMLIPIVSDFDVALGRTTMDRG